MAELLCKIMKVGKEHPNCSSVDLNGSSESLLRVKKLSSDAILLRRGSPLAIGYDLSSVTACVVLAHKIPVVPTDLSIAIAEGTYVGFSPCSWLAWKHSIDVGVGVIDADYRGAVVVILFSHATTGDRIAQLIIEKNNNVGSENVLCEVEDDVGPCRLVVESMNRKVEWCVLCSDVSHDATDWGEFVTRFPV
ncbi:hypothetical protein SUGI_0537690 [Cryptomeria japonica]|nr:hypothetical protein SUGI_0537690 [Cryptomeria japonica]